MTKENDRWIAKNTAFLYVRMLLTLAINLYSSRVILQILGVADYGIYNVVGGLLVIISFISGTFEASTQRFLNYEMGKGDDARVARTFKAAIILYLIIALLVLIVAETAGLWYVNNKLVIAPDRMAAANVVYQISIVGTIITVMQAPLRAVLIAHEHMDAYAIFSLVNSALKLGVAVMLLFFATSDTLIYYSWLILAVTGLTYLCYAIYARQRFEETHLCKGLDGQIVRNMVRYCASDFYGNICFTLNVQGVLFVLNRFGGTVLNAAGGITMTVSGALSQFGTSIISAFRPQIIKQYAAGDFQYMTKLIVNCTRFSALLFSAFAVPAIIEMDYILDLWLTEVPPYTADFCRLILIAGVGELMRYSINIGIHATGRIFAFSVITGTLYLIELPLMLFLIFKTQTPWSIYALHVLTTFVIVAITIIILHRLMPQFKVRPFVTKGIIVPLVLIALSGVIAYVLATCLQPTFLRLCFTTAVVITLLAASTWTFALDKTTRAELSAALRRKLGR